MDTKQQFTNRGLQGEFGVSFEGTLIRAMPDGSQQAVPIAAVGQVDFDGGGKSRGVRTLNVGGMVIMDQVAEGTYSVNHDGTGTARYLVDVQRMTGAPLPCVTLPPKNLESFAFVLDDDNHELQFIGPGIMDPDMEAPLAAVAAQGICRIQCCFAPGVAE